MRGELRDQEGAALRGASVRLISEETSRAVVGMADGGGRFALLGLPAGAYLCQVRYPFPPVWIGQARVVLAAGDDRELDLQLGSEAGESRLRVAEAEGGSAGEDKLDVPAGEAGRTAGAGGLPRMRLPLQAESVLGEVAAAGERDGTLAGEGQDQDAEEGREAASAREAIDAGGGVQASEPGDAGPGGTGVRADGLMAGDAGASVDGLSAEQGFRNGPRGAAPGGPRMSAWFASAAAGRISAAARGFSARTGGTGGQVMVASRGVAAGSRDGLHGSGFFQAREAAWDATNPFAVATSFGAGGAKAYIVRPADSDLRFGGAAGRAVQVRGLPERWRMGLFGAMEGRWRQQALFSSPETAGFFVLSAEQRALLANRGVGSAAASAALGYLSALTGPEQLVGSQWLGFGRTDLQPGARDRVSLGFQAQRLRTPATAGGQVADGVTSRALGSVGVSQVNGNAGTLLWEHLFGPRWVNEVRAQVVHDLEFETTGPGNAAVPAVGPGGLPPQVTIAPEGFSYGTPAALGRVAYPDERRVEVGETTGWRFGRHLLTVGGDWSRLDDRVMGATDLEGSFLYDSGTTGGHDGGLVDWISDYTFNVHAYPNGACPSVTASVHYFCFHSYSQSFANAEAEFVTHEIAGYAEDAMRLGTGLRLTVGARWEYQLLPFPLLPNRTLDAALAGVGAAGMGPSAWGTTASFPEDRNNVGPRVALSWTPGASGAERRGWLTVQAGYGMFFGRVPGATLDAALTETGMVQSTTRIRITPEVETGCPQVANQGFGYPCAFAYAPLGVAPVAATGSVVLFARRFRLPVVQRGSLAVERGVGRHLTVRAEYATAWATQLPQTTDLNIAPSTGTVSYLVQGGDRWPGLWTGQSFQVPLYTARRTAAFGPVTAVESNANATYHSGTAEAVVRGWHGWGGQGSFTFSRAIDYGPQVGASPRQDGQFDPFTDGYDKGRSSLDRPWGVTGELTYRSRWESGGEWGRQLLGGWGLAAVGRAGSGAPYSYTIFGGMRLAGGHESINGSGGATYLPTVGRNTLRLPMRSVVDLRTGKEIGWGRGRGRNWQLGLHADAFNLLNTASLSRVETTAFLPGTTGSLGGMTPLVFQDAETIAAEGVSTPAFGTPLSSTTGLSRERTLVFGVKLNF